MGVVFIEQLELTMLIGVHVSERITPQTVLVDIDMHTPIATAAAHDDVSYAVDYQQVVAAVEAYAATSSPQLVETMAEAIATLILTQYPVTEVHVTVKKPNAIAGARGVGVRIVRYA